jgi:glycosyltransferase involved in cell wall biosynthesis
MDNNKPKILIICDYYLPGYKSGGGMRTIVNTVDLLSEKFDFKIATRDHDGKLDKKTYTTVKINQWNDFQNSQVFYLAKSSVKILMIYKLIRQVRPEKIYTNSLFSPLAICVLILKKFNLILSADLIIAPCGELSENALKLKSLKKKVFLSLTKILKLNQNIIWKASSEREALEIKKAKGKSGITFVAPDLIPGKILENFDLSAKPEKIAGAARLVFVSRFVKIKNFKWILEFLPEISGDLIIDIYGPLEDTEYWKECSEIIKTLPKNIKVESRGSVKHEDVGKTLLNYHFFILPSLSENFGHIFLEALAAGCPLIISDKTPWKNLKNKSIGWDLNIENKEEWVSKLMYCINMDGKAYRAMSIKSRMFAEEWVNDKSIVEATENILKFSLKTH